MSHDPIWDAMKEHSKSKFDADRARFLGQAQATDDGGMYYRYKVMQGCQLSPKAGQWVPASTFRTN